MGKGGGGGGGQVTTEPGKEAERLARIQGDIAQQLFVESDPLRQQSFGALQHAGYIANQPISFDVIDKSPLYEGMKVSTERAFDSGRDRLIESTPAGGAMTAALGQLEAQRAGALASGRSAIGEMEFARRQANFDRALMAATGGATQGLTGVAGAGSTFANLQAQQLAAMNAQRQTRQQGKAGLGQAVGMAAGKAFSAGSAERFKHMGEAVDGREISETFADMPVYRWRYRIEHEGAPGFPSGEHIGPTAEQWARVGASDGSMVSFIDALGSLAAAVGDLGRRLDKLEERTQ